MARAAVDIGAAAMKLVSTECPELVEPGNEQLAELWLAVVAHVVDAHALIYEDPRGALIREAKLLQAFLTSYPVNLLHMCPSSLMRLFKRAADAATLAGESARSRYFLQWGASYRLMAMSRWWQRMESNPHKRLLPPEAKQFDPEYLDIYDLALDTLHRLHGPRPRPLLTVGDTSCSDTVQVLAVCLYDDPKLPSLADGNHRRYCQRQGYRYRQVREVPPGGWERLQGLPREPHYWKLLATLDELEDPAGAEWLLVIDCDAFFTNASIRVTDVAAAYGPRAFFFVAEEPAGINSGVLLLRRHEWTRQFLRLVLETPFVHVWDQSQLLWRLLEEYGVFSEATAAPPEHIAPVHQSHLNAYHEGTATSWNAYAWQPGDYIIHYAGCPWDMDPCWSKMEVSARLIVEEER